MARNLITMGCKETQLFKRFEKVIERGISTFVEVGKALLEIREQRLYRDQFDTFQDYCKERWGFDRTYAHRLIEGARVVENVAHGQQSEIQINERQARELARLPDEQQAEVWAEVIERTDGEPTAAAVAEVVSEYLDEEEEEEAEEEEPSRGFTATDTKDAYKECKAAAKLTMEEFSRGNLKAFIESILELFFVTDNRAVFQAKMENLINSI